ncbi:hypothetical protein CBOM_07791 [Ceraceosorus bombacis]|uniref:Uncharacterized protein n=1 Tax=Ceraceosorus bombacis TaxID=401625 RepID=A0A0P1BPV1_9BASI|nr:hypothetical protein CBOM_07791 [Ceraceosorus bombacis]
MEGVKEDRFPTVGADAPFDDVDRASHTSLYANGKVNHDVELQQISLVAAFSKSRSGPPPHSTSSTLRGNLNCNWSGNQYRSLSKQNAAHALLRTHKQMMKHQERDLDD